MTDGQPAPPPQYPRQCYRHPGRVTRIACRRCGRPICGECMIPASVGFQCPECVRGFAKRTRQHEGPFGGAVSANPAVTTYILIGLNLAVFALVLASGSHSSLWVDRLALSPVETYYGTQTGWVAVPGVAQGAVWQLVTSLFTHVQVMHIGVNMLTLWFLGPALERIFGRARFVALYLLAGLTGSAVVLWLSGANTQTLGASGSLFGLIAALLIVLHKLGQDFRQILLWLAINVVITVAVPGISWQGHLGGLVGGAAIAALLVYLPRVNRARNQWLAVGAYTLAVGAAIAARVMMLQ